MTAEIGGKWEKEDMDVWWLLADVIKVVIKIYNILPLFC
jgi:hypothetical protein